MNEITRIHLGRQPFTIAADAHKALRTYLAAIEDQSGGSTDVTKEVELRLAELLSERGIKGDKVVLMDDVEFLKEQLGDPKDFKDEDGGKAEVSSAPAKRLYRDTENGMLAGVAAGLANYFGIDVILVRVILLITIITGGWGLLLYIALWILIPEAKTSSDRLQMQGKSVTVDSLKEIVERADVHGAAHRATGTVVPWINSVFRIILKVAGIAIILVALALIFALITAGGYMVAHHGQIFQEGLFPVGKVEHLLVIIGLVWAGLASIFLVLLGMAMVRRRWPIATWATGVILGLLFIGLAAGTALTADVAPTVRQRVDDAHHTTSRLVQPFTSLDLKGDANLRIEQGNTYTVSMSYIDNPDLSKIKTAVVNNQLQIDTSQFGHRRGCTMLCLFPDYDLIITVTSPSQPTVTPSDLPLYDYLPAKPVMPALPSPKISRED